MIKCEISPVELNRRVDMERPNWRVRARKRTAMFRSAGKYLDPPKPFWREVKPVFLDLQRRKCAYCERQLEDSIEFDLEHYRPKKSVLKWPAEETWQYDFPTGGELDVGYYLLSYNLGNFAVACKPCNTNLKGSYFPVAAGRIPNEDNLTALAAEIPLLIFPIGDIIDDPSELIRFDGHIPVPVQEDTSSTGHRRARVTIDFFELHTREQLIVERCRLIFTLNVALGLTNYNPDAEYMVNMYTSEDHPHANCARCYRDLYTHDQLRAKELASASKAFLDSKGALVA